MAAFLNAHGSAAVKVCPPLLGLLPDLALGFWVLFLGLGGLGFRFLELTGSVEGP